MRTSKPKSHLIRWLFSIIGIPRGKNQLLNSLKFIIGEQYDKYEFCLEEKGEKTIKDITYDLYLYAERDFSELFGLSISRGILLLFNADVLEAVYFRFNGNHFEYLLKEINSYLPINEKIQIDPFINNKATVYLSENMILEILLKSDGNTGFSIRSKSYHQSLFS